ncbi:hypothetical protein VE02_09203 [Pseudogymnoascus sp. 03VT05]|nr:hypothetical protein VE02_09203 [Pseudogymnoascus sp. 03VT05]
MKISIIIPLFAALAAVKAQIAPGPYTIRSLASNQRGYVGRSPNEDTSTNPKPILLLDNGNIDLWDVAPATGGRYRLTIRQNPIGGFDDRLFAFLTEDPRINEEWFITPVDQYGPNNYIVQTSHKARGWVAPNPDSQDKQIALRPLIIGPSGPPSYPPVEIFTFTPLFS